MSVKYTKEILEEAVKNSISVMEVMRRIGIKKFTGGSHAHISNRIKYYEIDTSHFLGQSSTRGKIKKDLDDYFQINTEKIRIKGEVLRKKLIEKKIPYICNECGQNDEWNKKLLVLQVDHINGCFWDNRLENLQFLCPNCHTQTETYGRRKS